MFTLFFLSIGKTNVAQDNHFIYLQSENGQMFYVRMDEKLYSSTSAGYIILPKLSSGDYRMRIGFPKDAFPEEEYLISINGQNEGFLLKNMGENWSLQNIETGKLINESKDDVPQTAAVVTGNKKNDVFSTMLAEVVGDSSILNDHSRQQIDVKVKEETARTKQPVEENINPEPSKDMSVEKIPQKDSVSFLSARESGRRIEETVKVEADEIKRTDIPALPDMDAETKKSEDVTTGNSDVKPKKGNPFIKMLTVNEPEGQSMVYVNSVTGDTIRLLIPRNLESAGKREVKIDQQEDESAGLTITPTIVTPTENSSEIVEAEQESVTSNKNEDQLIDTADQVKQKSNSARIVFNDSPKNSACSGVANGMDFFNLRRKMASRNSSRKMIEIARDFFKSKCYTTDQVKNLSYLFLTDEGRYHFLDAAYPFAADPENFSTLKSVLTDPYYIKRFEAMIH